MLRTICFSILFCFSLNCAPSLCNNLSTLGLQGRTRQRGKKAASLIIMQPSEPCKVDAPDADNPVHLRSKRFTEPFVPITDQLGCIYVQTKTQRHFLWIRVRDYVPSVLFVNPLQTRHLSTMKTIQRLYSDPELRPQLPKDADYPLTIGDYAFTVKKCNTPILAYTGDPRFAVPAFALEEWPETFMPPFKEVYDKTATFFTDFQHKMPWLVWKGNIHTNPLRKRIVEHFAGRPGFNISHVDVNTNMNGSYVSVYDLSKYKYLLDMPGWGYSGRLPLLFLMGSVTFVVDRPPHFWEFYQDQFLPWQHYVPVSSDGHDLEQVYKKVRNDARLAWTLASNAFCQARKVFSTHNLQRQFVAVLARYTHLHGILTEP